MQFGALSCRIALDRACPPSARNTSSDIKSARGTTPSSITDHRHPGESSLDGEDGARRDVHICNQSRAHPGGRGMRNGMLPRRRCTADHACRNEMRRLLAGCYLCTLFASANGHLPIFLSSDFFLVGQNGERVEPGRRLAADASAGFRSSIAVRGVNASISYQMPTIGLGTTSKKMRLSAATFLKHGGRHIDTAQMYINYDDIRQALVDAAVPRDQVWITSKVNTDKTWLIRYDPRRTYVNTTAGTRAAIAEALAQLHTTYIDLMLIHGECHGIERAASPGTRQHATLTRPHFLCCQARGTLPTLSESPCGRASLKRRGRARRARLACPTFCARRSTS